MWLDLTQEFREGIPLPGGSPDVTFETLLDVSSDGMNVQRYSSVTHAGTHVDAPLHFFENGAAITDFPLDRFTGKGVVLDVARDEAEEVPVEALESAEGDVEPGDFVLLHTGWDAHFDDPDDYLTYPWFGADVAEWLSDREISLLGTDTISPDMPQSVRPSEDWDEYPLHRTLLGEGTLIVENLTGLARLTGSRIDARAYPMKIEGADGAPVRFVARERED